MICLPYSTDYIKYTLGIIIFGNNNSDDAEMLTQVDRDAAKGP